MDALPYVDALPEAYEQYALALIEEEMQGSNPPEEATVRASAAAGRDGRRAVRSELFQREMERLERASGTSSRSSDGNNGNDCHRADERHDGAGGADQLYRRPASIFDAPPSPDEANLDEWRRAVARARVEHEAERIRSIILAVEKEEQAPVWKDWNAARQRALDRLSSSVLAGEQQAVEAINSERQRDQIQKGERLQILAVQYHELIGKLDRLRRATAELSSGSGAGASK